MDATTIDISILTHILDELYPDRYPIGTRVRHAGEQYPLAYTYGTATVSGHEIIRDELEYVCVRDVSGLSTSGRVQWQRAATARVEG